MLYDYVTDWVIPAVGETFMVWDRTKGSLTKLKCVEATSPSERNHYPKCNGCYFDKNKCHAENINMTNLVCLAEQRPDNKSVIYVEE